MLIVLLLCFSSLARSAKEICLTQKDAGILNKSLISESSPSLLQTKSFMQSTAGRRRRTHVPEKCVTRKYVGSNHFSLGQSCCAATTQAASCLDGYRFQWSQGRNSKCALGIDAAVGLSSSWGNAGPRMFECHPSPVDDNGDLELGMPGTVHRRRWRYNEAGAEGKTGSCCNSFSCSACEEKFTIQALRAECGLGEGWLCASQHG
jgi:hypothetical protein